MNVIVLHIDDCPNWVEASDRVRAALDLVRPTAHLETRTVTTPDEATVLGFAGSPTILVDGQDLFDGIPTDALACRVYRTPEGLAGAPTTGMIIEALREKGTA
ncbi:MULTISPECIES: hypothetical protein [Leifsonia]|uniref:Alkylmercury lyase n=3 Tax=Leifsonia TaxID=110932 RepID=U2RW35_LEIAQ|nr:MULTISPECIES: hypothetical protein [Leifsonia]ERK72744.1 hypothetical protein N136_00898 [Leifsonia aquatica ATCC 14665]MBB2967237.1 hypothetical protein [Leifsonia aquatica]MBO1741914.1 thioredoxin family protein [Leifsonia sp. TF02-11]NYJ21742.1 hypothetical protein [Leifsonia shinshuensis]QIZ97387.1 thioredoxin family protein [Leifsonia sp. PS1209]